ncbi:MAG: 16S rRNA (cytidine(1402)-2'-O)-methyltransferase [Gammaproteobacteria bacterium]|nr:16S rRNA (cytidine(1402)-2'-O)-methyltransferase [Gammaproteobacteria bacterium]
MKRSSEFNSYNPLYLISSPIGNLSDITERQKEVLNTLDILYCEDTRVTKKLLEHLSIEKLSLDSYHDFSEDTKIDKIVSEIKSGLKVGLISDAGNPVISDPGYEVVRRLVSEDIRVIPVPGISAYTTALTISTIPPKPHMFYGFLSSNDKKRKEELEEIKDYPFTIIFYESPHRIKKTLKDMYNILGDRCVSLSRELTKVYEETIYFSLSEYEEIGDDLKGEMVKAVV